MSDQEWSMNFAQKLRKLLYQRGMSQKDLSKITGISEHTISKYHCMASQPTVGNIIKIANALGCSLDEIIML